MQRKQTLNINDNNFKMLFSSCLVGNYYPIFIDAIGRMKNEAQLVVPSMEEHTTMIVEKLDDTHIKINFEQC